MNRVVFAQGAFVFVAIAWLGILLGVSFLATPVKFEATSLSLPVALDVGRVTFALLSKVEWGLWVVLLICALAGTRLGSIAAVLVLGVLLALQAIWLLPVLDERVRLIIAGQAVAGSSHHLIFVGVETAKALVLFGLSVWTLAISATGQAGK